MTYEELWGAQVRTKAEVFAYAYSTLQNLLKSRTKAGHIHGYFHEEKPNMYAFKRIEHESDTIKVKMWVVKYPPSNIDFRVHFITKR